MRTPVRGRQVTPSRSSRPTTVVTSARSRFVTATQQGLALAAVLAVLAPAANVVSLEVVRTGPGTAAPQPAAVPTGVAMLRNQAAQVEQQPVDAVVTEVPVTSQDGGAPAGDGGEERVTSGPTPVEGFATVGVTWATDETRSEEEIAVEVRTRGEDGAWSGWAELEYHDEHGPTPGTPEAERARPGTEPLIVGAVEDVQVRATGDVPADLRLAIIEPGESAGTVEQPPAIDTGATEAPSAASAEEGAVGGDASGGGGIVLQAGSYTAKPQIFSRAQWGADERLRRGSPSYHEVHAGFVHHTVNGNDYTRAEVPGIIRSIYAYHTQSRGWSDVGYNFLVDKFGRVWEGRAGGVDRPVVGAHTMGYNEYSFAMSAIGNFDIAKPTSAMLRAYGELFAWKLSLHGVDAASMSQRVGSGTFPAVNGHRDAGSTACPGRYLYDRLPTIRSIAVESQQDWSGRDRQTDVLGSRHPDVVVRRASDKRVMVLPTGGLTGFARPRTGATGFGDRTAVPSPDVDGDGHGDVLGVAEDVRLWSGNGSGGFTAGRTISSMANHTMLTAVGDLDGDGRNDVVGRASDGRPRLFRGNGRGGFWRRPMPGVWRAYRLAAGVGDATGDGHPDLVVRDSSGRGWLMPGDGAGAFGARRQLAGSWSRYDALAGGGDYNADGKVDLVVRRRGVGHLLLGRGDGTFSRETGPFRRVRGLVALSGAGSVAGSAAPDLVGTSNGSLVVLRNTGRYDLGGPVQTTLVLPDANALLNVGDWDRDGDGDLVSRKASTGRLLLHPGDGRGGFAPAVSLGTGFGSVAMLAAVGDVTGDGWPDVMGQPSGGSMRIYPGQGAQGLAPSYVAHSPIPASRQVGFGRWDDDGAPDNLFRAGDQLLLYPGNGPGGLTNARTTNLSVSRWDWIVGVGDTQMGRRPDVVVRDKASGELFLVRTNARGFTAPRFIGEGGRAYDLVG